MNKQTEALNLIHEQLQKLWLLGDKAAELANPALDAIKALAQSRSDEEQPAQQSAERVEPCGWQFFQDGKWHNGMETNNHRANTEAAGVPVRDVYPAPQQAPDYAWPTIEDYEKEVGFEVNNAFKAAWTMARTTNDLFNQMGSDA